MGYTLKTIFMRQTYITNQTGHVVAVELIPISSGKKQTHALQSFVVDNGDTIQIESLSHRAYLTVKALFENNNQELDKNTQSSTFDIIGNNIIRRHKKYVIQKCHYDLALFMHKALIQNINVDLTLNTLKYETCD